jgi:hypothetical protein
MTSEMQEGSDPHPKEPSGRTLGNKYFMEFTALVHVSPKSSWSGELLGAFLGAVGGAWLGHDDDLPMEPVVGVATGMIGMIIGAILGVLAIITRACDTSFLRKARKANILPITDYLWPFFTIVAMGIMAAISLLAVAGVTEDASTEVRMTLGGMAGFFVLWTLASLPPALGALIVFIRLIELASDIRE